MNVTNEAEQASPADKPAERPPCATCAHCFSLGAAKRTECRKAPPVGHLITDKKGRAQFMSFYPPTLLTDWCGGHS